MNGDARRREEAVCSYREALSALDDGDDEDGRQVTAGALARLLIRLDRYDEAEALIEPTLARSDQALLDAARSSDGRARAMSSRCAELHALLSLCRLRRESPNIAGALVAAEMGRARLLADALTVRSRQAREHR